MPCPRWIAVPATVVALALTFSTLSVAQSASEATSTNGAPGARPMIAGSIGGSSLTSLGRNVPEQVIAAEDLGVAPSSTKMTMQLILQRSPEQQYALKDLIAQEQLPGSPTYQQQLTPKAFGDTFGLASSDLSTLKSWLGSQGFKVTSVDNAHLTIAFTGTAAEVETAFHTEIHNYKGADGAIHYANSKEIQIPAAFAPVVSEVWGLESFNLPHGRPYDGPVSADTTYKQTNPSTKSDSSDVASEKEAPKALEGVTEFHNHGSIITSTLGSSLAIADLGSTPTTTTVTTSQNPIVYGTNTVVTLTGTITWTSGATPTGSITFYDVDGYLGAQILLTSPSCTTGAGTITCTYQWVAASAASPSPDLVTAAYSGDVTYAPSSGTLSQTVTPNAGNGFIISDFTDNPDTQAYGASPAVALEVLSGTLALDQAPTGTILITGNGGIGYIDYASSGGTCTIFIICYFDFNYNWTASKAALLPGVYTLTAAYSGNQYYESGYTTTDYTVVGHGTVPDTTTITANPNFVSAGSPGTTFTTVTTWTGSGIPPVGSLDITRTSNGTGLGTVTYPIAGAFTSVGSGLYDGGTYSYSYNCTTNTTAKTITCTVVDSNVYALIGGGANSITAAYHGDETYLPSSGTTTVTRSAGNANTTTVTSTLSPVTYGESQAVTYIAKVVGSAGNGQPSGTITFSGTPVIPTPQVVTITAGDCTHTGGVNTGTYTCTVPSSAVVVPPLTAPGAYTVTAQYSGSTTYNSTSGTVTETVQKQTPALSTPTVAPNTQPQGSVGPVVLTSTFSWLGTGLAPTGAVSFTVDGANVGAATCTAPVSDSETCTLSYNPSALTVATHLVRATYPGDTNYNGQTSGSSNLVITTDNRVNPTLTLVASPAGTTTAGVAAGTQITLTATLTHTPANGSWAGGVTFIDATSGVTLGTVTTSGTGATTTAVFQFTPSAAQAATYPAGFNQFTATYSGNTCCYFGAGPVNANPVYIGGLLFSLTLQHNFSTDPGTVDGTTTPNYGIQVYNFSAAAVPFSLNFTNSNQGTNAFGFGTNCPNTIAAGGTCELVFSYLPPYGDGNSTTVGRYEAGSWTGVSAGTILGVGLKGFAAPPRAGVAAFPAVLAGKALLPAGSLSVTPLNFTFGPLAPGAQSKTLQIGVSNPNTTAVGVTYTLPGGAFTSVNNCPSTLNGGASCTIQVTFKSSTTGTQTASVTLAPAGGPNVTVALTGIVQATNGLTMSTDVHGFGNIPVNTSGTQFGLSITNNAATAATLGFSLSQPGTTPFNIVTSGCPASLAAGAQCSVIANFKPTAAGAVSDVLTVTSNQPILPGGSGSGPYTGTVTFTGAGTTTTNFTASTSTHNWGKIPVATTGSNYGVQLTNNTAAAITLTLGTGFANNLGFSVLGSNCGASLAVNASCELIFTFTPTSQSSVSTTYGVSANGGAVQLYSLANGAFVSGITLMGTGVSQ